MIGSRVGKYQVTQRLGRGSMGTVYRAVDETLHRDVAIKVLNAELSDPDALRRFKAEAVAIARLNHPGIAKIFELFQHGDQWLMAIEFVQGETLEQLVSRSGPVPVDQAVGLVIQALDALDHAHRMAVVHRDLKPANLMVSGHRLKVTDFGIARVAGSEHLTSAGLRMGTPGYMAPEQVMGEGTDARADIFAMGCVLYYLVSARLPFEGDTPLAQAQARMSSTATPLRSHRPDLPVWLDTVLAKALEREPARRFQTALEFRDAIATGTERRTTPATQESAIPAHLMETVLHAVPPPTPAAPVEAARAASAAPAPSQTPNLAPPAAGAGQSAPAPRAGASRSAGSRNLVPAAIAVVLLVGSVWWFTRSPGDETVQTVTGADGTPVTAATPSPTETGVASSTPVATGTSDPAGTPVATATPVASGTPIPTETAGTPGATPGAKPAPGLDAPISFDVKAFEVPARRDEEDASVTITGGTISVSYKRQNPLVQTYRGVAAATYVRDRNPRWASGLASPPDDLDLSRGITERLRRPRNWLVLQGKTWFAILALPDDRVDEILNAVQQRMRVKIDRPAPAK